MSESGLCAVIRREIVWLRASPTDQALWIWSPLLAVGLILWLFSAGVPAGLPIAVLDQDHSASSRELVRRFEASRAIVIRERPSALEAAWPVLRSGAAYALVQIPAGWERDRLRGAPQSVILYNNTQYYLIAGLVSSAVREALASLLGEQAILNEARFGGGLEAARLRSGALRADLHTLFNPQISYELYLGGMLPPLLLHIYIVVMAVSVMGREFRDRSVDAWMQAAGGQLFKAILGKCVPALVIHMALGLGLIGILIGLSGGLVLAQAALWYAAMVTMLIVSLTLAVFLLGLTGNLRIALSLTGMIVATAPAYSGFTFPLDSMGSLARTWGQMLPITHYLALQQGQWMSGASLQVWALGMLKLAGFAAFFLLIGAPMLRRQVRQPQRWGRR